MFGISRVTQFCNAISLLAVGIFSFMFSANTIGALSIGGGSLALLLPFFETDNKFEDFFDSVKFCNLRGDKPELKRIVKTDYGHNYIFTLPIGMNIDHFIKVQLSLEQFLDAKVKISYNDKEIQIVSLEEKLSDYYHYEPFKCDKMEIVIGYSKKGLRKLKLNSHMLICGASGFGKSTFERGLIVNLIQNNKPSELILNLCDFKRNELGLFKNSKYVNTFVFDKEGLTDLLKRLEKEALRRYELFEAKNVLDIDKFNKINKKLPYIVTIVDELAQCEGDKVLMGMLQKRISYDRAAGMYYVICCQRPSIDLIPGSVKANIDTRICFHTVDSTNSWIVLDDKEAAQYLELPGRGLLRTTELEEFQAMYISEDEVTEQIKHTFIDRRVLH